MGRSGAASAGSGTVWHDRNLSGHDYVAESVDRRFAQRVFFLLCNSCYWCASDIGRRVISRCPACNRQLEPLPIAAGELFKFDYGQKRGVRDFLRT